jgi:hypothetical protein
MQRTVLKVVVGLVAVGVLLVGVIAVALPRLVNSDEFRLALHETVAETLGTPVEWESLDVRLLPLRLAINAPVLVAAAGNPEEARLTAESLDLRLALLPIFARRVQIDSLVLHGVELVVTRTAEGFLLPIAASEEETPAEANSAESADDSMAVEETAEEGAFGLALNRIVISKSRIIVRDRTVPEPIEWRLEDLEFEAKSRSDDERLEIELAAKVRSGTSDAGRIQTAGTVSLAGLYDLDVEIEELLLAELQPYLPGPTVTGMLSGRVSLEGATSTLSKIDLDLSVDQLALRTAERDFVGGLTLQASQALGDPVAFSAVLDLETGGQAEITGKLMLENDGSIRFSTDLATSNGGRLGIEGTSNPEGVLDVRAEFESFDLVIAGPFLPDPKIELAGLATGNAQLIGAAGSPESVSLDVAVESGLLRLPDYFVEGPFLAKLVVESPLSDGRQGRIDLDLTAARLEYQNQFKKPAGMRAEMTTKFSSKASGEIDFESRIKLRDINEILLQGAVGDSTAIALTVSSLNLAGLSDVLPAIEPYGLEGIVHFQGLGVELIDDAPSLFDGRIVFERVKLSLPDAGRLRIQGAIVGEGTRIRTKGLRVLMGGMTVGIDGRIDDPLNEARFALAVKSIGEAEANDFFSTLTSRRDTVFGSLRFAGDFEGAASGKDDFYSSLEGAFEFSIGKDNGGRLRGVSILRSLLDQIPLLGGAARLTQPFRSGRSVDDYFTERFEIIEGDIEIGQGQANAKKLRLAYEGYEVKLSGPVRLRDLTIDMTGEVVLKEDLVSVLGGLDDAESAAREPIRIPLARVTNTLAEPKIEMTKETLAAVPRLLLQGGGLDKLVVGVGKALGRLLGGDDK